MSDSLTASPAPSPAGPPSPAAAPDSRAVAPGPARGPLRLPIAVAALLLGTALFLNIDPLLAWDDANPYLGHGRQYLYFTTQSNLLAVAALIVIGVNLARRRAITPGMELLRGLATVDMAITGLVYGALLSDPSMPWTLSDFLLHQLGPVAMVVWWIAMPPRQTLRFRVVLLWLLHPLLWSASAFVYASESSDHFVPYFFLDPAEVGGWGAVLGYVAAIHVVIAVLGVGAVALSRAPWRRVSWRAAGVTTPAP